MRLDKPCEVDGEELIGNYVGARIYSDGWHVGTWIDHDWEGDCPSARLVAAAPELVNALRTLEARLTKAANAFYVSGKASALREAFAGWRDEIQPAREVLAKIDAAAKIKPYTTS